MTAGTNNPLRLPEEYSEKELLELVEILSHSITDLKNKAEYFQMGKDAFLNMLEDINESYNELQNLFVGLVSAMVNALDAKSPWTKGHSERVANYAGHIAKNMGFNEEDIKNLQLSGMLHDIGKIGTYDYLLEKQSELTEEEFSTVKKHPVQGAKIIEGIKQLSEIVPVIRYHHEKIDGSGYPEGLKGNDIPVYAKILHVADAFDSMTSDRPYRNAPGIEYAVLEFKKYSNIQFDSRIVNVFLEILNDKSSPSKTTQ
jgi:putative nucleotidyltransferase with HDIG domain